MNFQLLELSVPTESHYQAKYLVLAVKSLLHLNRMNDQLFFSSLKNAFIWSQCFGQNPAAPPEYIHFYDESHRLDPMRTQIVKSNYCDFGELWFLS